MIRTGKVIGNTIGPNSGGDTDVRLLIVELSDGDDIQTVEYYDDGGRDYLPPDGAEVVVLDISPSHRVAVAVDDLQDSTVLKGELELYSLDAAGTTKAAKIKLDQAGVITVGDGTDFAVRFSVLEAEFNKLVGDLNALVGIYNGHTHVAPAGGGDTAAPVAPDLALDSEAEISGAKIDEIKVP
jgi:phage gp45-like